MSLRPLIGITADLRKRSKNARTGGVIELNRNYLQAIEAAGGVCLIIPPDADAATIAPRLDGLLISGGRDIDAGRFGQPNHPKANLQHAERFDTEMDLIRRLAPTKPILGICYGCQFLNVAHGGTINQHLPDAPSRARHTHGVRQRYSIVPGSLLATATGADSVLGASYHHQAVEQLGKGLKCSAVHADGTIEALESEQGRWLLGVQWHPERSAYDPANAALFRAFVEACTKP